MEKEMTLDEFLTYTAEQIKACATDSEKKPRMKALAEAWTVAKQAFLDTESSKAKFTVFEDPAKQPDEEIEIDPVKAAADAERASAGQTLTRKAADEVLDAGWPSDMNCREFLDARGEVRKGDWGLDADQP